MPEGFFEYWYSLLLLSMSASDEIHPENVSLETVELPVGVPEPDDGWSESEIEIQKQKQHKNEDLDLEDMFLDMLFEENFIFDYNVHNLYIDLLFDPIEHNWCEIYDTVSSCSGLDKQNALFPYFILWLTTDKNSFENMDAFQLLLDCDFRLRECDKFDMQIFLSWSFFPGRRPVLIDDISWLLTELEEVEHFRNLAHFQEMDIMSNAWDNNHYFDNKVVISHISLFWTEHKNF